jgi:hypothetical protein
MNHIDRVVFVEHEDDLEKSASSSPAPDEPLVARSPLRVRTRGLSDDVLRLFGLDAMAENVPGVSLVPAKLHPY